MASFEKRTIAELTDVFECIICAGMSKVPTKCDDCDALYCKACIDEWLLRKNGNGCTLYKQAPFNA